MHDPFWLFKPPYSSFSIGMAFCLKSMVSIYTGEDWGRFGRVIKRAEETKKFWRAIMAQILIGVCLIGYSLYRINQLTH